MPHPRRLHDYKLLSNVRVSPDVWAYIDAERQTDESNSKLVDRLLRRLMVQEQTAKEEKECLR